MGVGLQLRRALSDVARVPRLLVACDFDGTIAPIVARPGEARALPESADALGSLAALGSTTVALISGRALADLARLSGMPAAVHLVGSHGAEFGSGFVRPIDERASALLVTIEGALSAIAARHPGVSIETKPASVALHVRNAAPDDARAALAAARSAARSWDAQMTEGKAVLEFAVIEADKGEAIDILRDAEEASAAIFIGDDVTDEKAFRRLREGDVGIKVGPGDTAARYRVSDPVDVAAVLDFLVAERRGWLSAMATHQGRDS